MSRAHGKLFRFSSPMRWNDASYDGCLAASLEIGRKSDYLKRLVLTVGISDRPLLRVRAGEDRYLAAAFLVQPLDAPIAGLHPILEDLRRLRRYSLPYLSTSARRPPHLQQTSRPAEAPKRV